MAKFTTAGNNCLLVPLFEADIIKLSFRYVLIEFNVVTKELCYCVLYSFFLKGKVLSKS